MASAERNLTVPNVITGVRLAAVPLFAWLLLAQHDRRSAALLLAAIGTTDWVDGYIARRFDQVSALGKVLDPVADRMVLIVGVTAILADGSAPVWLGAATLSREALVSVGTLLIAALGGRRIDVQWFGKAGTFGLYLAYPMFLASNARLGNPDVWRGLAWICAIPGLALAWVALGTYVPMARQALQEKTT